MATFISFFQDWPTEVLALTAAIGLLFGIFAWYINITITARFSDFKEQLNGKYLSSALGEEKLNNISNRLDTFDHHWDRVVRIFEAHKCS